MSTEQTNSPRKLRILFVVDSDDQANPLISQIKECGYDLSAEIMKREDATYLSLTENHQDLVFCLFNGQSPGEGQLLEIIDAVKANTPVVYFAETATEQDVANAMKSGISDFVVGVNSIHLVAVIEREFNRNKLIRECSRTHERYQEIIDTSSDAIIALDSAWKINFFSKGAENLFGYTQDEAIGRSYASLIQSSQPKEQTLNTPNDTNEFDLAKRRDITIRCKDGSALACEMNMSRSRVKGDKRTYTVILRDISDRKAKEEELIRLANYDALTDIFNRHSFYKALRQEIKQADRDKTKFALLYIDLDGFKEINDNMGHVAGDQLLKEFAHRLKSSLREVDTVARMGGDEFTAILHNINIIDHASKVAGKILDFTCKPFTLRGKEVNIGTSIGISIYPDDSDDHEKLISYADSALYLAKTRGRNRFVLYKDANTDDN